MLFSVDPNRMNDPDKIPSWLAATDFPLLRQTAVIEVHHGASVVLHLAGEKLAAVK